MKKSIKEKRKDRKTEFLMIYYDLIWFFDCKNKYVEKGFCRTDAEVLSYLIDVDSLNESKGRKNEYGYFMCTSSYIHKFLICTEITIFRSIKKLQRFGVIDCKIKDGKRYIKLNEPILDIIEKRYNEYCEEIDNSNFFNDTNKSEKDEEEKSIYNKYTLKAIKDIDKLRNKNNSEQ